jgi:ribA/ribD-fused uncharacterized protein
MEKVNKQLANAFERMQSAVQDREKGQRTADNMIIFEDRINPLSLGYPTMILFEGKVFHSAEHLILYFKAKAFDDSDACEKIAKTGVKEARSTPIHRYNPNHWKKFEHRSVDIANQIKVKQCEEMRTALKQSGTKRIVYAAKHDQYFGCGLTINDDNVLFPQYWKGQNALGKILENIRKTV